MVYAWKNGSHINVDANVAGKVCSKLEAENRLNAKNLLEESRPVDSELHSAFEWDNDVAAEKYRLEQAGHIIRCITVKTTEKQENGSNNRYFFRVESPDKKEEPVYKSIDVIMHNPDEYKQILKRATSELNDVISKYNYIKSVVQELEPISREIEILEKKVG